MKRIFTDAQKAAKALYDKARVLTDEQREAKRARDRAREVSRPPRPDRKRGARTSHGVPRARCFVALDSEGFDSGPEFEVALGERTYTTRRHRTFLWYACRVEPNFREEELSDVGGLDSERILSWLADLPYKFPQSIFVSYAFGYDIVQALADLPYPLLRELQHECPLDRIGDPTWKKPRHYSVEWRGFKLSYRRGKYFTIKRGHGRTATIYDVFSYFQCRFLDAIEGRDIGEGTREIIEEGKARRVAFDPARDLPFARRYTAAECRALCYLMNDVRSGMAALDLVPRAWHGPGALASGAIRAHGARDHAGAMTAAPPVGSPQQWGHHAYFGGRIELMGQGVARKLYSYDINSAYPAICARLPSMRGGEWIYHKKVTREMLASWSVVSMVALKSFGAAKAALWFPLPYRTEKGAILFPAAVNGYYMADEARAALEYADTVPGYDIVLGAGWQFVPAEDTRPYAFVAEMYEARKAIPKSDIRNKVIKLVINSMYGKLAQAVGTEVPPDACVWYAAAITAGTRAALVRAALPERESVVMFATDGIITRKPLLLPIGKGLGQWESDTIAKGVFVKSGIYTLDHDGGASTTKSRGVSPEYLRSSKGEWIAEDIVAAWAGGIEALSYPYRSYITLGLGTASEAAYAMLGSWALSERSIDIEHIGSKRESASAADRTKRLRPSWARSVNWFDCPEGMAFEGGLSLDVPLSTISRPDWLDGGGMLEEMEQAIIELARG